MVVRQDGSMLVEASMNLDDFMEAMDIMNYDQPEEEGLHHLRRFCHVLDRTGAESRRLVQLQKPGLRSSGYGPRTSGQTACHAERRR